MVPRPSNFRAAVVIAIVALCFPFGSRSAVAKKGKRPRSSDAVGLCVDSYKTGLEREQAGQLVEAREVYIRCAKSVCGSPLREECTARFTHLSTHIPSVVPVAIDAAGRPLTDVEVKVDGDPLTSSPHGQSFLLDPGVREFSFSKDGHIFATQTLMIVQGQRDRLISASLQSEAVTDNKRPQRQRSAAAPKAVAAAVVSQAANEDRGEKPSEAPAIDLEPQPTQQQRTGWRGDPAGSHGRAEHEPTRGGEYG